MAKQRKKDTYEKEIEETAQRMLKYPEALRSARSTPEWKQFLLDVGILPEIVSSDSGKQFWSKVKNKIVEQELGISQRTLEEKNVEYEPKGRGSKFRSKETGRFVSKKSLEN